MKNIAVIGSGSWGVALAIHLAKLGNNVKIWSFDEEEKRIKEIIDEIKEGSYINNEFLKEIINRIEVYSENRIEIIFNL